MALEWASSAVDREPFSCRSELIKVTANPQQSLPDAGRSTPVSNGA
jgi:hypothetical protein